MSLVCGLFDLFSSHGPFTLCLHFSMFCEGQFMPANLWFLCFAQRLHKLYVLIFHLVRNRISCYEGPTHIALHIWLLSTPGFFKTFATKFRNGRWPELVYFSCGNIHWGDLTFSIRYDVIRSRLEGITTTSNSAPVRIAALSAT